MDLGDSFIEGNPATVVDDVDNGLQVVTAFACCCVFATIIQSDKPNVMSGSENLMMLNSSVCTIAVNCALYCDIITVVCHFRCFCRGAF